MTRVGEFVESYRLLVGSILLGLILIGSGILLWREGRWKPNVEMRLASVETELGGLKTSGTTLPVGAGTQVNAGDLIEEIQAPEKVPAETSGKVAGTSTTTAKKSTPQATAPSSPNTSAAVPASSTEPKTKAPVASCPVNINTANLEQLDVIPQVGPSTAQKIIDYRNAHGSFTSVEQLDKVSGIGSATIEKMRPCVTL